MKKKVAALLAAGTLVMATTPVYAEGFLSDLTSVASEALDGADLSGLDVSSLLGGVDLNNFNLKDVDVDKALAAIKDNEIVKNLDVSSLNIQAAVDLLDNTDLLGKFGIKSVDKEKLLSVLQDKKVSDTINKLLTSASKGESIQAAVKELVKSDTVENLFTSITGAKTGDVAKNFTDDNLKELVSKGAAAVFSAKTGESSELATSAQSLLQNGLNILLGK